MCIFIYVCVYTLLFIYMYLYICVCVHICLYIRIYIFLYICLHVCECGASFPLITPLTLDMYLTMLSVKHGGFKYHV